MLVRTVVATWLTVRPRRAALSRSTRSASSGRASSLAEADVGEARASAPSAAWRRSKGAARRRGRSRGSRGRGGRRCRRRGCAAAGSCRPTGGRGRPCQASPASSVRSAVAISRARARPLGPRRQDHGDLAAVLAAGALEALAADRASTSVRASGTTWRMRLFELRQRRFHPLDARADGVLGLDRDLALVGLRHQLVGRASRTRRSRRRTAAR